MAFSWRAVAAAGLAGVGLGWLAHAYASQHDDVNLQERVEEKDEADAGDVLDFLLLAGRLKTTKRTGWVHNNVPLPESIADHMYRMGLMALVVREPGIDPVHAMRVAIVHDLAEAIVGDITPNCGISDAEKHAREVAAISRMAAILRNGPVAKQMAALWHEYEDGETDTALFVKDLDKFEMILTAFEYELANKTIDLQGFFDGTKGKFKTQSVKALDAALRARRADVRRETHSIHPAELRDLKHRSPAIVAFKSHPPKQPQTDGLIPNDARDEIISFVNDNDDDDD